MSFTSQGDHKTVYKIPEFRIEFVNISDVAQPPEDFTDSHCARVLQSFAKEAEQMIVPIQSRADVEDYLFSA